MNRIFTDEEVLAIISVTFPRDRDGQLSSDFDWYENYIIENAKGFMPYIKEEKIRNKLIAVSL